MTKNTKNTKIDEKLDLDKLANYNFDDDNNEDNNINKSNTNTNTNKKTINEEEPNTYDMLGDDYLISDDEEKAIEGENMEDYNERLKRSGVVYLSYIPQGLNSTVIREKLDSYGVNRIFLVPGNN